MRNQFAHMKKILGVYLKRGHEVKSALLDRNFDEADKMMKWRDAAFYNLKAAIFLTEKNGIKLKTDDQIEKMIADSEKIDAEIAGLLKQNQMELLKEIQTFNRSRRQLTKYQSGRPVSSGFENSA